MILNLPHPHMVKRKDIKMSRSGKIIKVETETHFTIPKITKEITKHIMTFFDTQEPVILKFADTEYKAIVTSYIVHDFYICDEIIFDALNGNTFHITFK